MAWDPFLSTSDSDGWKSPTTMLNAEFSSPFNPNIQSERIPNEETTPRAGMTRSRREELELWREKKRQKLLGASGSTAPRLSTQTNRLPESTPNTIGRGKSGIAIRRSLAPSGTYVSYSAPQQIRKSLPNYGNSSICDKRYQGLSVRDENKVAAPSPRKKNNFEESLNQSHLVRAPSTPLAQLKIQGQSPNDQGTDAMINARGTSIENAQMHTTEVPHTTVSETVDAQPLEIEESPVIDEESGMNECIGAAVNDATSTVVETSMTPSVVGEHMEQSQDSVVSHEEATTEANLSASPPELNKASKALPKPSDEYDISLLLLANDTLLLQVADSEARRTSECERLRHERDELKLELHMQEARFRQHAQRVEEAMQQGLLVSMQRIQQLTEELEEARNEVTRLKKSKSTKKGEE